MKLAVLSDIHSNSYALEAVLDDVEHGGINKLIVLGDMFGYYPWAAKTYQLLRPYLSSSIFIRGNHDQLLLDEQPPVPVPSYWEAAKKNTEELVKLEPDAIEWLQSLESSLTLEQGRRLIKLVHGTPADELNGRYYPDDNQEYSWFPVENEYLLMGHTHYPLYRKLKNSLILNPGSVGQPRDGEPMPSWAILDVENGEVSFKRSSYDNLMVMELLREMDWEPRAIAALNKTYKGSLHDN